MLLLTLLYTCISCVVQDAAGMVAPDNPIALGLAAEVGVNAYATITLPGILKVHVYTCTCTLGSMEWSSSYKIYTVRTICDTFDEHYICTIIIIILL